MKILYCISSFSAKGGTEKVLSSKVASLSQRGHEISILISDQHDKPLAYDVPNNIGIKDLKIKKYLKSGFKGFDFFRNIFVLRKIYEKEIGAINPDLIIVLERGYEDFIIPYIYKSIPKIREYHFSQKASEFLESLMDTKSKLKSKLVRKLYERQYKKYDAFVVLTEKDYKNWSGFKNVRIIPNIIEGSTKCEVLKLSDRPKKIISVGSMVADRKGFSEMIKIWGGVAPIFPEWSLHIYGDGPYRKVYESQIKELGLQSCIFLEGVSHNIHQKYCESQIFLMTSKGEGLPMVIIEAQQNGLPVIAYDCFSGPSDILRNNFGGYLITMHNEKDFSEKLIELLQNPEHREKKGEQALENSKRFMPEMIIPIWEKLFSELCKR